MPYHYVHTHSRHPRTPNARPAYRCPANSYRHPCPTNSYTHPRPTNSYPYPRPPHAHPDLHAYAPDSRRAIHSRG